MTIKASAFDVEGNIIDVEPAHHGGWITAAGEIGVKLSGPEEAIEKVPNFIGGPDQPIIEQIFALLPDSPKPSQEQAREFLKRKWVHYEALLETIDLGPRPGFLEVLTELRKLGLPTALGTAVELERGLLLLKRSGLDKLFLLHHIVLPTDVKNLKPAPDCFLETARRMGVSPAEQLVFEDSPRGVKSGVAAGSRVIGMPVYDNKKAKGDLLAAGVTRIFTDWRQINVGDLLKSFA